MPADGYHRHLVERFEVLFFDFDVGRCVADLDRGVDGGLELPASLLTCSYSRGLTN